MRTDNNNQNPCDYEAFLPCDAFCLREPPALYNTEGHWSERHLQCVWYNDALRPAHLVTTDGEPVEVKSCGRWNLEAGPDFRDAVLFVGKERRRLTGDVEVHIRPSAWKAHGHSGDPRYANVIAHVTYFPTPPAADLPSGAVSISLRDPLRANPGFSFSDIDISAYPHAILPPTPRPCQEIWGSDPARGIAILRSAGMHRLDIKRQRMLALIAESESPFQALYESVMAALGYKRNAPAFRMLARAFPVKDWSSSAIDNFAVLLGLGGLLPNISDIRDEKVSALARRLWDAWWQADKPPHDFRLEWHFDSVRPLNHPLRRLAAAAALFTRSAGLAAELNTVDIRSPDYAAEYSRILSRGASFPEMEGFGSFTRGFLAKPAALIGPACAAVITTNAVVPYVAAVTGLPSSAIFTSVKPEQTSAPMRTMAVRLFGRDHNPAVLYEKDGILQQGLLQIFNDFCLNSRSGCSDCKFGRGEP